MQRTDRDCSPGGEGGEHAENLSAGEEKKAILSAIVESSDDAIISKSLEGIIMSWNAGAEKILGYTEAETLGKHISLIIPPELKAEEEVIISSIKAGRKIHHYQTIRMAKSGRMIPVSLTISPVKDGQGNIIGASKILRDISERLKAEQLIKQSAKNLAILNAIGRTISEKLDVQDILQKVADATAKITEAEYAAFFYHIHDERRGGATLFALSGTAPEAFGKLDVPDDMDAFGPDFMKGKALRKEDIRNDPPTGIPHYGLPQDHPAGASYLAVPVISSSDTVIGGLFFGHRDPGVFTEEHEEMVASIASQTAVALDNSRLFEEVKSLNAKKDEFIALASHELKTPLTTIKGYLQILQQSENTPEHLRFIEKTLRQVEKLNSLVSDFFDIAKIEAGKLQLERETFDLRELLSEVTETFGQTHPTHRIAFRDAGHALWVDADRQRMEQVIVNLLSNAVKYSPDADVVHVSCGSSASAAEVKIRDEGIGLSPEEQERIFNRFYRVKNSANISGLGLGLYLTRDILERHNGRISISSAPGKGSEFRFLLPLKNSGREAEHP
ncbi:PAS domain S-box protein [Compostibacter hankyongensis]|uniref:histidine kinase n=1 Tax=Compostibacter hankyongensis TaxID=1007089 RepID=A0ABP8FCQ1_9BACT